MMKLLFFMAVFNTLMAFVPPFDFISVISGIYAGHAFTFLYHNGFFGD